MAGVASNLCRAYACPIPVHSRRVGRLVVCPPGVHSLEQVIADAQRVGYDGEPWIDRATGREKACIDHIEIIQLVRFAVAIERARLWVVSEADRPVLMRHASQRDALAEIQIAREEALMAFVAVHGTLCLLLH